MSITISGENNNDRILAQDGVIDQISGINIVGVLTATSFVGDVTGNVTGNLTGNVNSTSPLLLQTGGSERFRITGNNELGIAGANYGSSGQVLTSGGSGSAVSWTTIPTQASIANNADNRIITGGSGTNLNGESTLNYGSGHQLIFSGSANPLSGTSLPYSVNIYRDGGSGYGYFDTMTNSSYSTGVRIRTYNNTTYNNVIEHTTSKVTNFQTDGSTRLSIDSDGRLLVGRTSAYAHADADNLIVGNEATNEHQGITILSHSGKYGGIYFGDGAGTNPTNRCKIIYDHPNDQLRIGTGGAAATQFYINSSGYVGINQSPSTRLDVKQDNGVAYNNRVQTIAYNAARFLNTSGHTSGGTYTGYQFNITGDSQNRICSIGMITEASNSRTSSLVFATDDGGNRTEKLRITSAGDVGIGTATIGRGPLELSRSDTGDVQIHMTNAKTGGGTGKGFTIFGCNTSAGDAGFVNRHAGGAIEFYTNQSGTVSEKLRINSSGTALFTTNELKLYNATDNSNTYFYTQNTGAGNAGVRMKNQDGEWTIIANDSLRFRDEEANADRLNITSSGTIQFNGDANPQAEFDRGSANNTNINLKYNGTFTGQVSAANGDFQLSAVGGSTPLSFYTNGGEKVRIGWNGDNAFLRIADNNTSSAGSHGFRFGSYAIQMRDTGGYNHWYIRRNYGGWQTQPQVTLKANGYTGVGRLDPTHTLDVDGTSVFRDRIFFGSGSMKSVPFGANVTYDTGISINGYGYGGSIVALCSRNYGAGTSTQAGLYFLEFKYDGNHIPTIHHVAGDNFVTFNKSASNTLTVLMGASNNIITMFESSVVNP